jgi:hypothetical protein
MGKRRMSISVDTICTSLPLKRGPGDSRGTHVGTTRSPTFDPALLDPDFSRPHVSSLDVDKAAEGREGKGKKAKPNTASISESLQANEAA